MYVGAIEPYKKIDCTIRALAYMRRELGVEKARLVLIGNGSSGEKLRCLARTLGIESSIEWLGMMPHREVGAWYAASIGTVLLSECEAFPLVPLEAMKCGAPVIASN